VGYVLELRFLGDGFLENPRVEGFDLRSRWIPAVACAEGMR